ncbi:MAG: glyoxalase [Acidobacteria bacterium]|nr:glyoxalase [Acidobacteriota bacterium]
MIWNRSIPRTTVIPVLAYRNANDAAEWLCKAFDFTIRLRVDTHRVQLNVGEGAVIVRELRPHEIGNPLGLGHSITVRVEDADAHCHRAKNHGARITQEPQTHPYGERQYVAEDLAGHSWTFSQSVADMLPEDWGGTSEHLQ